MERKRIILAGRLIDGVSRTVRQNQAIVIEDGKIREITEIDPEMLQLEKTSRGQVVVTKALDKTVMPGLINGHCHLCFSAGGTPADDVLADDLQTFAMRSQQHCLEALASGVTALRDCGSKDTIVLKLRNGIEKGIAAGSRILSCGRPVTSTGGHCWFLGGEADGPEGMRHMVRTVLKDGADFVKVMVSGGNMTPGSGPNINQFGLQEMRIAAEEAHMHGKHLSVHVHSAVSVKRAFEAGADVFDHCSWKDGEGTAYDERCAEKMIEKGAVVCPALGAPYRTDPEVWFADRPEKAEFWKVFREQRFALTRRMIREGMKIIGGDDAGCRLTKFYDYWKGLKLMEEALGMSPMDVIRSTTYETAAVMGMENKIGALKPGMEADLLVVEGNPDEDLSCLAVPEIVFLRGKIAAERGKLRLDIGKEQENGTGI